jgi:hypothetical protein
MGSQDQHRETGPQTAADALAKATELEQSADALARESGAEPAADLRRQAQEMRSRAAALQRHERQQKTKQDAVRVEAHRKVFTGQRTAGANVPDLNDILGGGDVA